MPVHPWRLKQAEEEAAAERERKIALRASGVMAAASTASKLVYPSGKALASARGEDDSDASGSEGESDDGGAAADVSVRSARGVLARRSAAASSSSSDLWSDVVGSSFAATRRLDVDSD